ncbi:Receptor-like protein kinase [Thalictrum thalictroides]|uniref:Receptor-like protein kinase n=1 Tax=Thalictrum thalictroides TaxID=46969 RepID=A0A7J6WFT4_THATH|nr:Receptor-like protein kinase [Thalictrum thalictroides]
MQSFLFLIFFCFNTLVSSLNSDGLTLLSLKSSISTDPTHYLDTWFESDSTPCKWVGITCDTYHQVTRIFLPNKSFTGYIPSELSLLTSLQHLSLSYNNFTKPIPSRLFNLTSLISLDLSHNSLTGSIPDQIKSLKSLNHLDLSSNHFNGSLPDGLTELPQLSGTLNLSCNQFSGQVPDSFGNFPVTVSLDLRHNNLSGKIPQIGSLLNQGPTPFAGNPNLCGFPIRTPCPDSENPRVPLNPKTSTPKTPKPKPSYSFEEENPPHSEKTRGSFVTVPIISGVSFIVGAVSISVWALRKKWSSDESKIGKQKVVKNEEEEVVGEDGKFVVMDEGFGLELEDLLRASAYVVGKSRSGIVYKVVAGRGSGGAGAVVAVRRLSEGGSFMRLKEFELEMESIASVDHPNIVRLRAYYYASDEKLVVSDFITNGSLYSALHGGPANCLPALSWAARLRIAQGTARGLMYIHECSLRKYVHGNIKSSKILLDNDLQPYISGFGLTRLVSSTNRSVDVTSRKQISTRTVVSLGIGSNTSTSPSLSYLAPEARISGSRMTQKCDVYSFGIVVLELLTGRLPQAGPEKDYKELECYVRRAFREQRPLSEIIDPALMHEVSAKKQVLDVFHIALNCTEIVPEMRPRMKTVAENLERVGSH